MPHNPNTDFMKQLNMNTCMSPSYQEFINTLPCGFCVFEFNQNFTIQCANQTFYELNGMDPIAVSSFSYADRIHDPQMIYDTLLKHQKDKTSSFGIEYRLKEQNNKKCWLLLTGQFIYNQDKIYVSAVFIDITEKKKVFDQLRLSEAENRIAFADSNHMMDIYDLETKELIRPRYREVKNKAYKLKNVPNSSVELGIVAKESVEDYLGFFNQMYKGIPTGCSTVLLQTYDHGFHWFSAKYTLLYDDDGLAIRAVISYEDVSELRNKEMAYQKWSHYFNNQKQNSIGYYEYNLSKNTFDGSEETIPNILPDTIQSYTEAVKFFSRVSVFEEDIDQYLHFYNRERLIAAFYGGKNSDTIEYRRKKGEHDYFWAKGNVQLIIDPYTNDLKAFVLVQDIDADKRNRIEIQNRVERDELTSLYNRFAIRDKLDEITGQNSSCRHAFLMLDIDYFKSINDSFGHQFGDKVLKDAADVMQAIVREGDLCARFGGDEFIIVLKDIPSLEIMEKKAEQFCRLMHKNYENGASTSVSLGVVYPIRNHSFNSLYQKADVCLYEAKRNGRNQFIIFHEQDSY